jgi:hypothetical protein
MATPRLRFLAWFAGLVLITSTSLAVGWYTNWFGTGAPPSGGGPTPPKDVKKPTLDEAQREFLWQVEHHGLVLGKHGFGPLAQAITRDDVRTLEALLAPKFVGRVPRRPREVRLSAGFAQVVRQQDAGRPPIRLSRDQFIARLREYRRPFSKTPAAKFSLKTLGPVVREKPNGLWEGTALFRMWGEQGPHQPGEVILHWKFRVPRPTRKNLAKTGWLRASSLTLSQVAHAPRPLLREVAARRGIDTRRLHDNDREKEKISNTGGVFLCDFNRDGILDMLVTDVNRYFLYQGTRDGHFVDVTTEVGLPKLPAGLDSVYLLAAFVDLDGDGWEDLILGNRVYRNIRGKRFEDYTDRTNLRLPLDAGGIVVADYDRDGRMDLYVTRSGMGEAESWLRGKSGSGKGNELWHNLGNWQFEDVTARSGAGGGQRSTFSAVWLDADNDGWPDLYVINEFGNGVLLINQRNGTFKEHALTKGPCDFGSMGVAAGDIDNDGHIDIYVANMYSKAGARVISNLKPGTYPEPVMATIRRFVTGSQLHHNRGGLDFEQRGEMMQVNDIGWAYGAALIDLDNDGWLDLVATCGFMSTSRKEPDG